PYLRAAVTGMRPSPDPRSMTKSSAPTPAISSILSTTASRVGTYGTSRSISAAGMASTGASTAAAAFEAPSPQPATTTHTTPAPSAAAIDPRMTTLPFSEENPGPVTHEAAPRFTEHVLRERAPGAVRGGWWAARGSNPRPPGCKPGALTN